MLCLKYTLFSDELQVINYICFIVIIIGFLWLRVPCLRRAVQRLSAEKASAPIKAKALY